MTNDTRTVRPDGWPTEAMIERAIRIPLDDPRAPIPTGTMFVLPCPCWVWAITPEMGDYHIDDQTGLYHHPHCEDAQ